ncbi:MAG: hypothetical protein N2C14_09015, partial [Planctomycetales bacterium]
MFRYFPLSLITFFALLSFVAAELGGNQFVKVAESETGGHFFSQVIHAPTTKALVSWGTRTHAHKIRAHETQHFLVDENRWINAFPHGKADAWAGKSKQWPDWDICETRGSFYEREGVTAPRPTNSFHQVCWDDHNRRLVFY